jgi:ubiquinone/menaquinone biosynthesis C-methylase UbiE
MTELRYDEAATKRLLAIYSTPDVAAQREQFVRALAPQPGERVLDVGCGPGFLAASIAQAVGPSGAVCGVDISEPLLAAAHSHCASLPWVEVRHADAMRLPFADAHFDAVVCTQVLEYVRDVDATLAGFRRVLRRGGRAVIVDTDGDSIVWHSSDPQRMRRVLAAWAGHATDYRLPRTLAGRLRSAGLRVDSQAVLPLFNPAYDPDTYSNRMIDLIAAYVAGRAGVTPEEAEAWSRDLRAAGERGEYFFSLNRYLFSATKA